MGASLNVGRADFENKWKRIAIQGAFLLIDYKIVTQFDK